MTNKKIRASIRPGVVESARVVRFNSQYNYVPRSGRYEQPRGESLTIPGEAKTIKQLVERLQLGVPLPDKSPGYLDTDLDKIDHYFQMALDLTDMDDLSDRIRSTKDYIEQAKIEQAKYKAQEEKKRLQSERELEIKEAIEKSKLNAQ